MEEHGGGHAGRGRKGHVVSLGVICAHASTIWAVLVAVRRIVSFHFP